MVLYTILAIIIIVLIIVESCFIYVLINEKIVEEAEERKLKVQRLPFEENLKQLSELNLKGETRKKI